MSDLERAEERGEMGETKIMELEEELKVIRMLAMMVVVMRMKMVVTLGATVTVRAVKHYF